MIEHLIIVTGLSGAGKTTAIRVLEDLGYDVVDNLPPSLLPGLIEQSDSPLSGNSFRRCVAVVDSRSGGLFAAWPEAIERVKRSVSTTIVFFDASDTVLVQRFKETRRRHPTFGDNRNIVGAIGGERALLRGLRDRSDRIIDTSDMSPSQLRVILTSEFGHEFSPSGNLTVIISSFGFKHGLPLDADLVFDVRFLANPHYVPSLKPLDGRDPDVEEYVMADQNSPLLLYKLLDLLDFCIPRYVEEGKSYLTIAIGCTGGRHRSVVLVEKLNKHFLTLGYHTVVQHRDLDK